MKHFIIIIFLFFSVFTKAQCAMCRAVLESEGDTGLAQGINDGITWLMVFPYILIGGVAFFIFKSMKKIH